MLALRRAFISVSRNRCLSSWTARICNVKSERASYYLENYNAEFTESQFRRRFCSSVGNSSSVVQSVSSSWPETKHDDESIIESELSADNTQHELGVSEYESDAGDKISPQIEGLTKVVLSVPPVKGSTKDVQHEGVRMRWALNEWVEAGNIVTPAEVSFTLQFLRRNQLLYRALQLFEWLELREEIEYTESDYATRIDLIAKLQGTFKAEEYLWQIPKYFRSEIVYNSLLRSYVAASNVHKAEKLFRTMKNLFRCTSISYNQMLFLYHRIDRKRFADIVSLMEKENVIPSSVTYQILIDVEGHCNNIRGVEQIFQRMNSSGVEPSLGHRASLARYYAAAGRKDKAEEVLKEMEGGDLVKNRAACYYLLPVYASLGRDDEVGRIWRACESNLTPAECIVAIKAWGQLRRIEDAEAAFEEISKILGRPPSCQHYAILLHVYADHKMVTEGEDLFRRLRESGAIVRIQAWDALVKLYAGVGDVEKADTILEEAIQYRKGRPNFKSYFQVLEGYTGRGDVQNAEKIFAEMSKAGYTKQVRPYHTLLSAYINAKNPAAGFDERLRRNNIAVDGKMARLLAQTAAFRRPVVV